jgi:hypothetical protein
MPARAIQGGVMKKFAFALLAKVKFGNLAVFGVVLAAFVCLAGTARADNIPYGSPGTPITSNTDLIATRSSPLVLAYFYGFSAADTDFLLIKDVTTGLFLSTNSGDSQILTDTEFFDNQSTGVGTALTLYGATAGNILQLEVFNSATGQTLTSNPLTNTDDPGNSNAYVTPYTTEVNGIPAPGVFVGMEDLSPSTGTDFDYNDDQYVLTGVGITPEPSSLLLLGTGLLGLAFVAFRKARPACPTMNLSL